MSDNEKRDKLLNILKRYYRRRNTPDLHSFNICTNEGRAFIEMDENCVFVDVATPEGWKFETLSLEAAADKLVEMGADLSTLED